MLIAGVLQIVLGVIRAGAIADFVPSSVIKGLLAAIGLILILKQIPHLVGHDANPLGMMSFEEPDHENTFSELMHVFRAIHPGAAVIGAVSILILLAWDKIKRLKQSLVPAPLIVVLAGVGLELAPGAPGRPVDDRHHAPGASAGGGQPGRLPRIPAVAGLLGRCEPATCSWRP